MKAVPPIIKLTRAGMNELTELTICEAARLLSKRSISSTELVEATLSRIEETELIVHAYVQYLRTRLAIPQNKRIRNCRKVKPGSSTRDPDRSERQYVF
jgi:Asp-tRNA(Asn)/Glu-tRNA(Gln) amidotransferase A subunit family amidase